MTTRPDRELYQRADGSAWVGEVSADHFPQDAVARAPLPSSDDPRWQPGRPTALDVQVLTLSPFYPSQRLGVTVEQKTSRPLFRHPNHPPFEGAVAWMPLGAIRWSPLPTSGVRAELPAGVLQRPRVR